MENFYITSTKTFNSKEKADRYIAIACYTYIELFCKKHNLPPSQYASLEQFKKEWNDFYDLELINKNVQ